jgi:hypothetical protein
MGSPVIDLNYLLSNIIQQDVPLNWDLFWEKQQSKEQLLKVRYPIS